jgi:hypothetical protein
MVLELCDGAVDAHGRPADPFCSPEGKPMPIWNRRPENQVVLAPGATAAIDVNWASIGESCQWADWVDIHFDWTEPSDWRKQTTFRVFPSEWPMHICSLARSFGYRTAEDFPSSGGDQGPALRVSLLEKTVYNDEHATLHIELAGPAQSSEKPAGCASLYTVSHTAAITRLGPLQNVVGGSRVDSYTPEQIREDREREWPLWRKDLKRKCDVPGGATSAEVWIGDAA